MKQILFAFCLFLGSAINALADAASDAAFVVDAHLRSNNTQTELSLLSSKTVAALIPSLENMGAKVLDPDRFKDALLGEFDSETMALLRRRSIIAYQDILTPDEISALAAFYRTEEGRRLLETGLTPDTLEANISFLKDGPGAPMLRHLPELQASIQEHFHAYSTAKLTKLLSLDRIADIVERKDVVSFQEEGRRREVVQAMRNAK